MESLQIEHEDLKSRVDKQERDNTLLKRRLDEQAVKLQALENLVLQLQHGANQVPTAHQATQAVSTMDGSITAGILQSLCASLVAQVTGQGSGEGTSDGIGEANRAGSPPASQLDSMYDNFINKEMHASPERQDPPS